MSDDSDVRQGQSVVTEILSFDLDRKHKLVEVYDSILKLAEDLQGEKFLVEELKTEFGDFQKEIPNFKKTLLDEECPIVVAGETSAGKSGFINLLIGSDILPVSSLACTSTIVKIHNSTNTEIRITSEQGNTTIIKFVQDTDSETISKEVKKYVILKGEVSNCQCVDIYLPVPMLKGKTVIVDTPGIGTTANPELTARLFKFLPHAVAFIYIIDAGHAGGLENDRLLAIFEEQRKLKQSGKLIEFDVSRTIFVCNKWDLVEEEEEEVYNYILQTLNECWPKFQEEQLFLLSVKEEKKLAKQQKISEKYQKLLFGIEKLIPNSSEAKSVMNARWQHTFLTKTIERIFSRIQLSMKSQTEKQELNKIAEKRLLILRNSISEVMKTVITKAELQCADVSKKAYLHINNQETKTKMFQWKNEELMYEEYPNNPITSIGKMKLRGEALILGCIEKELKDFWQKEEVERLGADFEKLLLEELHLFDEQSKEVRKLIINCIVRNDPFEVLFENISYGAAGIISIPFLIPAAVVALISLPFVLNEDVFISIMTKHTMDDFKSKPLVFMRKWAEEILPRYSEKNIYSRLESEYIKSFEQKVRHVCEKIIPKQIEADTIFAKNVTIDIRSYIDIRRYYLPYGEKAKAIMGKLLIIYIEYFPHFLGASVSLRNCTHAKKLEGRFAHVDEIEMLSGKTWVKAVVKTMKQVLDTKFSLIQITEVDAIRQINHPHIVQIYGTSIGIDENENKHLKLCMEQLPESLEDMILKNRHVVPCCKLEDWNTAESENSKEFYIKTMSGVSSGLAHLHEEGFIHRDLKMSNVFIKDKVAKLADAGLLQPNGHTYTANGTYIPTTVAPEVFTYGYSERIESDIYSIGILMWEVYYCRPGFTFISKKDLTSKPEKREEYKFEVKDALQLINRIQTGHRPAFEKYQPVPKLIELISKCWSGDIHTRPTAKAVSSKLGELINS